MASVTYEVADESVVKVIDKAAELYHAELKQYDVKIMAIMAFGPRNEEDVITRPAIRKNGNACAACIRVLPLKERLVKHADAEMTIDGDKWEEYNDDIRIALVDHELSHLDIKLDKDGNLKKDSLKRPMLGTIRDDIVYWGNSHIAERHGENSIEVINAKALKEKFGEVLQIKEN